MHIFLLWKSLFQSGCFHRSWSPVNVNSSPQTQTKYNTATWLNNYEIATEWTIGLQQDQHHCSGMTYIIRTLWVTFHLLWKLLWLYVKLDILLPTRQILLAVATFLCDRSLLFTHILHVDSCGSLTYFLIFYLAIMRKAIFSSFSFSCKFYKCSNRFGGTFSDAGIN